MPINNSINADQLLDTTASPIFAGLNLTGFDGIVQASGGALSASTVLPDGTTAVTQSPNDNSTKLATTAYADAAGGTGKVSGQFSSMAGNLVVCDLSQKMLKKTLEKDDLIPVRSHIERLPFPGETFDRIVVVDSIHHFCDPREAIRDLLRVLKPGGRMVIEEPDIQHFAVKRQLTQKLSLF